MKRLIENLIGRIAPILLPVLIVYLVAALLIPSATIFAADELTITTTSLPIGTYNASYSKTLNATGGNPSPSYTWSIVPGSGDFPSWASLDASAGIISGTPDAVGTNTFTVKVSDNASPTSANDTQELSLTINKAATSITVADVSVSEGTTATLTATLSPALSGKTISFSINGGSSITATTNSSGVATKSGVNVSGIAAGTHADYIQASFAGDTNYEASSGKADLTITEGLSVSTIAMRPGYEGGDYSQTLQATGGSGSYTWSKSGTLPGGLSLSSAGIISGTASSSSAGVHKFTVTVTDSSSATDSQELTILVRAPGYLYNWGDNTNYQLGNNSTTYSDIPIQTTDLDNDNIIAAATGGSHNLAIKDDGDVYAWGLNDAGQLGNNSTTTAKEPDQADTISDAIAVAAGYKHSLALKNDGSVYAWGDNAYGQLGTGDTSDKHKPTKISTLSDMVAVSAGYNHSLALKSDGTVWAWGYNSKGQLGIGTASTSTTNTTPVQVKGEDGDGYLTGIVAIAAGYYFNLALDKDGNVWAWGDNSTGQLGNDSTATAVKYPVQAEINDVIAIAAGYLHSLAIDDSNDVYAWGDNAYYQLGDGTTSDSDTPQKVDNISDATNIAAGYYHSLAIDEDGDVYAWGYNNKGQLGINSTTNTDTPEQVASFDGSAILIAANGNDSMAISSEEITATQVSITTTSLDDGAVGDSYSETLAAEGGSGDYTWSKSSGTLPTGLSLNSSTGKISGTPTKAGDFTFTIKAADSDDTSEYDTQSFTVTIDSSSSSSDSISITTSSLPDGQVNKSYSGTLTADGGSGDYTWSKSSGTLPPGLSIATTTGKISGTPTTAGDYSFVIKVKDNDDASLTDTASLSITIASEIATSTVSLSGMTADTPLKTNQEGLTQNTSKLTTADGQVTLTIPTGIKIMDSAGKVLTTFSATKLTTPPLIPDGFTCLLAYTFGPNGANFSAALTSTFKFNQTDLPSGVQASSLSVHYYDGTNWSMVASTVDAKAGTVTAKISHFSVYALMGKITASPTPTQTVAPSPLPTVQPPPTGPGVSPTVKPTPTGSGQTGKKANWGLLIGVTLGVLILVLVLIILIRRSSSRTH